MKRKSNIPEEKLLPYDTICAATRGDPDAMAEVLRHFDGYISLRATPMSTPRCSTPTPPGRR